MDNKYRVYKFIEDIFVDSNWYFRVEKCNYLLELSDISPHEYYVRDYARAIYLPFIKKGIKVIIKGADTKYWSPYFE